MIIIPPLFSVSNTNPYMVERLIRESETSYWSGFGAPGVTGKHTGYLGEERWGEGTQLSWHEEGSSSSYEGQTQGCFWEPCCLRGK